MGTYNMTVFCNNNVYLLGCELLVKFKKQRGRYPKYYRTSKISSYKKEVSEFNTY